MSSASNVSADGCVAEEKTSEALPACCSQCERKGVRASEETADWGLRAFFTAIVAIETQLPAWGGQERRCCCCWTHCITSLLLNVMEEVKQWQGHLLTAFVLLASGNWPVSQLH